MYYCCVSQFRTPALPQVYSFKHPERYEIYLKNAKEISQLASETYRYLRVRSEFWRQQDPMYNRVKAKCKHKTMRKASMRDDFKSLQRLVHMLQDISDGNRPSYTSFMLTCLLLG